MYLTGFADEAAKDLAGQIAATRELGWTHIESRAIDGVNIHDLDEAAFDRACGQLADAGVRVNCFGSTIANWGKRIDQPFDASLAEARRAIPRMKRLGTGLVRIMSFAVLKDAAGRPLADQMDAERFRRVRELQAMFAGEGLQPVHENCMNYGGLGWRHTLRLLENVPGLRLVFDTGNPVFTEDIAQPAGTDGARPRQSAWEFYAQVREHVAYVHVKDGRTEPDGTHVFTYPGEGRAEVRRILADLLARGYDGGISIEPHMASVFHDPTSAPDPARMRAIYVEYGRRVERMLGELRR